MSRKTNEDELILVIWVLLQDVYKSLSSTLGKILKIGITFINKLATNLSCAVEHV